MKNRTISGLIELPLKPYQGDSFFLRVMLMNEDIFQLKKIALFLINDLGNFIFGIFIILFIIYIKAIGIFTVISVLISLFYFFKGILVVIDLVKKDYVCEELELFRLYNRKFDWLIFKNYHEIVFLLKGGQKLTLKSTLNIDIKLRSRVRVCYLKKSKILYSIYLI